MRSLRTLLCLALALVLVAPASATWSIVVVNRKTGEVAVASATCIADFPLIRFVPVVVVGEGAGAAQSFIDNTGQNRMTIFDGLAAGDTPADILAQLAASDSGHQTRQYGIAAYSGPPVTFTGTQAGAWAGGVTGSVGDWEYAIQGNVLTGAPVVRAAEDAFVDTVGDTGQRIMAAMEAAAAMGGDGRCSCTTGGPTDCGSPPSGGFTHSAYTAFLVVSRMGDVDGTCNNSDGCANGDYYLRRQFNGNANDPDPVVVLRQRYDAWRATRAGRPDHVLTEVTSDLPVLQADGVTSSTVTVRMIDIDGVPLTGGGLTIDVARTDGQPVADVGSVTDHGNGTYSFPLTATTLPGRATYTLTVDGAGRDVQLHPPLGVVSLPPQELHAGETRYSVAEGTPLPLVVSRTPADAGRPYRVLASYSGTMPGTDVNGVHVPLNRDRLFEATLRLGGGPPFAGSVGVLDASGRAEATLDLDPGAFAPLVGSTLSFCALLPHALGGGDVTNVAEVLIEP